jgi:hypothetical protein
VKTQKRPFVTAYTNTANYLGAVLPTTKRYRCNGQLITRHVAFELDFSCSPVLEFSHSLGRELSITLQYVYTVLLISTKLSGGRNVTQTGSRGVYTLMSALENIVVQAQPLQCDWPS